MVQGHCWTMCQQQAAVLSIVLLLSLSMFRGKQCALKANACTLLQDCVFDSDCPKV